MALQNAKQNGATKTAEPLKIETLEVFGAHEFSNGAVGFNAIVNGISIYGMTYRTINDRNGKGEVSFIGFPARKGSNEKYYNHVWFKISEEDIPRFEKLIDKSLANK